MKSAFFTVTASFFCLLVPLAVLAAENTPVNPTVNATAYTAMRVVQKQLGADTLGRIVEISGRDGVPQPFLWKVVLKESAGVREVDVAGGKVVAQRTIVRPVAALTAIHLQELNLDSSGAFEAADAQARKARLRFDSLNYTLRSSETTGKPIWTLELFDGDGAGVGAMRLAAHDGATLTVDGRLARIPAAGGDPVVKTPPVTVTPPVVENGGASDMAPAVIVEEEDFESGFFTRTGRTLDKASRTVTRHLRKTGQTLERFFTGHGDSDEPSSRD
jgi:hypothetical protein